MVIFLVIKIRAVVKLMTKNRITNLCIPSSHPIHTPIVYSSPPSPYPKERHSMQWLFSEADKINSNPAINDPLPSYSRQVMVHLYSHMTLT